MSKYCPKCGAEVTEETKFCGSCGAKFEGEPWTIPEPMPAAPISPPPPQPQYVQPPPQPQGYATMPPKKSNAKLIGALIAVIVAVIIIAVVVFLFLGGADSRFVGTWEYEDLDAGMTFSYRFNGDESLDVISLGSDPVKIGTWSVSGDELCFELSQDWYSSELTNQCVKYSFSDGGTKLTLTSDISSITLTKK